MFKNKKGATQNNFVVLVLLVGGLLLFGPNIQRMFSTGSGAGGTTVAAPSVVTVNVNRTCDVSSTTLTANNLNKYIEGVSLSNEYTKLYVNGADAGQVADQGTKTVAPFDKLLVLYGENSTLYYTSKAEVTVPCSGALRTQGKLARFDTAPSFAPINDNGDVDTATDLGPSTEKTMRLKITATNDRSIGNPELKPLGYKNVVCLRYNSTVINSLRIDGESVVSLPKRQSDNSSVGLTWTCSSWPIQQDNEVVDKPVVVKTASTEPTADHNISITIDDVDYFVNNQTGALQIGVEDEEGRDVGVAGNTNAMVDIIRLS